MLPLFEMFMKANGGDAYEPDGRQFGLSQAQVQSAVEALLPAFSIGLKPMPPIRWTWAVSSSRC